MNAFPNFIASSLTFGVTGAGVTIDPATGLVSLAPDRLSDGLEVNITAGDESGAVTSIFRVTLRALALPVAPLLVAAPAIIGSGVIGSEHRGDLGVWDGAVGLAQRWRRDGVDIPGAEATLYAPVAADDLADLTCRVTATNTAGSTLAETAPLRIVQAAPVVTGALADLTRDRNSGVAVVAAAPAFSGAALRYAVSGAGAGIDAVSGVVSISTAALVAGATVTVTATNSGGSASTGFRFSVVAPISAPAAVGVIADVSFTQDSGAQTVSTQANFNGVGLVYALVAAPVGVAIQAGSGLVSIPTTALLSAAPITVRASNAGGSATQSFAVTVRATFPAPLANDKWTSYNILDSVEAGGVRGLRATTIASDVIIAPGYKLHAYMGGSDTPTPTAALLELTAANRRVMTGTGLGVGTTIYPKLYCQRVSDGAFALAGSRPSYVVRDLTVVGGGDEVLVSTVAALQLAVNDAPGGRVIKVAPGIYATTVEISNVVKLSQITIEPQTWVDPPVFRAISAQNCRNIRFRGLRFEKPLPAAGAYESGTCLNIKGGTDMEVVDCLFIGGSQQISADNNTRTKIWYNTLERCGQDCLQLFGSQRFLTITHNRIQNYNVDLLGQIAGDAHPDMMQFNCNLRDAYSADVTITDNIMAALQGGANTHGILTGKAALWQDGRPLDGVDNESLPWVDRPCGARRFVIERNFIRGNHRDGIHLEGTIDFVVRGNLCRRVTDAEVTNRAQFGNGPVEVNESRSTIVYADTRLPSRPGEMCHKNLLIDNNVVSRPLPGGGAPWSRATSFGTVTVSRHVLSETAVPIGWVMPVAGKDAPR